MSFNHTLNRLSELSSTINCFEFDVVDDIEFELEVPDHL